MPMTCCILPAECNIRYMYLEEDDRPLAGMSMKGQVQVHVCHADDRSAHTG